MSGDDIDVLFGIFIFSLGLAIECALLFCLDDPWITLGCLLGNAWSLWKLFKT